jgi:pilus assembly protein CpaB
MVYDYLQKAAEKTKAVQGQGIIEAAADIPLGNTINFVQVKSTDWPKDSMPPGAITDPKGVVGRVAIRSISTGEPITETKLVPKEGAQSAGIMSYIVPEGHRAVTVAVNEVAGVAGFLTPNNKVDVVVTIAPTGSSDTISKIVLQNVPILATGQLTEQKEGKPVVVPTVTLDLTPEDSEKLVLAASKGTLEMLLRNVADNKPVETRGATISRVLGGVERSVARSETRKATAGTAKANQVRQPSPSPPSYSVEVIKGKERSTKQFTQ